MSAVNPSRLDDATSQVLIERTDCNVVPYGVLLLLVLCLSGSGASLLRDVPYTQDQCMKVLELEAPMCVLL